MGRGKGGPYRRANWPEDTRSENVLAWATKRQAELFVTYATAIRDGDFEVARSAARQVVDVAYRLDTFARQEKSRWLHRLASSPKL